MYKGKIVLAKDSRRKINTAQRRRGWMFRQAAEKISEKFEAADGRGFEFGRTKLRFPGPVPHGESESELGWILPCVIEKARERVLFAPDVQGPVVEETVELIMKEKPSLLMMGGPPTYLRGYRIGDEFFRTAARNMERIVETVPVVVVDHHLLRDEEWSRFLEPVRKSAEKAGNRLMTAAEYLGEDPEPLECKRRRLYEEDVPGKEFLDWAKLSEEERGHRPPPLQN
jgi:predicted metallo-beta-lactamase superfamily hydrolase